ncbi:MAG: hypothetical protein WD844_15360 [Thermoleophilaceae bacterium]
MRVLRRAGIVVVAVAATGALSFALFGDGSDQAGAGDERYLPGNSRAGAGGALSQVPEADCSQWRRGSPRQRSNVVEELGALFDRNGGARLPGDYATGVLDRACAEDFASAFKLWKVYERALGFQYDRSVLDR